MARFRTADKVFAENVRNYRMVISVRNEADEELKDYKREILNFMEAAGVDVAEVEGNLVVVTRYDSYRFDSDRFRKEHEELYAEYLKCVPSMRFTIKDA